MMVDVVPNQHICSEEFEEFALLIMNENNWVHASTEMDRKRLFTRLIENTLSFFLIIK